MLLLVILDPYLQYVKYQMFRGRATSVIIKLGQTNLLICVLLLLNPHPGNSDLRFKTLLLYYCLLHDLSLVDRISQTSYSPQTFVS